MRRNLFRSYDFATSRAAALNDHARENVPFSQIGERTVTVEVTSVVRSSELSLEVRVATREAVSVSQPLEDRIRISPAPKLHEPRDMPLHGAWQSFCRHIHTRAHRKPAVKAAA